MPKLYFADLVVKLSRRMAKMRLTLYVIYDITEIEKIILKTDLFVRFGTGYEWVVLRQNMKANT